MSSLPTNNVGILALETHFPTVYVKQEDLEVAYGVSKGKYTLGLGQDSLAFVGDNEDINSIALTVVQNLLDKYSISPSEVGRLEIGTESLIDKSKSTKTVLMRLFGDNVDVEGTTVVNACYGGTAALLNALNWADSSAWDGRYAIVVAADIAVYAAGPARPTGGCGAVAMLVGRNAPLQIDLHTRAMHSSDTWDFFKPNLHSEYPVVNGTNSQTCYLTALDDCYNSFVQKNKTRRSASVTVENTDYFLFHSPYNKLVQKGIGRLLYLDMVSGSRDSSSIAKWASLSPRDTYEDKDLEAALKNVSADAYKAKLSLPCEISRLLGNTYTASVYLNLCYLVSSLGAGLVSKNVVLFSYGSGALASMFRITPVVDAGADARFSLERMQSVLDLQNRLAHREKLTPEDMNAALKAREDAHDAPLPFKPTFGTDKLAPGTYYLEEIKASWERIYSRKPTN